MKFIADLHIHSKYSRATSKDLTPEQLYFWAQLKGITVVGTGDFLHPGWLKELKTKLEPAEEGLFQLKKEYASEIDMQVPASCKAPVRFILSAEVANIYKRLDKVRKVHNVIFAPSFDVAQNLQKRIEKIGNIRSDGRPILGLDSRDLLEITLESHPQSFLVPAHIWTPWFSMLGSKGGFDKMEDCYGDLTKYIFALETGLSSDPLMNWRLSQLDQCVLISNSDAHSAPKLGREANIFDTELSYAGIFLGLSQDSNKGFLGTIEFFPEEGKYHYDGHRDCDVCLTPKETIKNKGLCPKCGKPVTVGVMARVEELADRPEGQKGARSRPYKSLIQLETIIAEGKGVGPASKPVQELFYRMLSKIGNELSILNEVPLEAIKKTGGALLAEGISRMRQGKVSIAPGYDGEYGVISLFSDKERATKKEQLTLF
ncbi:MAG TPA: endonuclease Q family protein [Candidatus Omnitrophota bacterium]|nr:endonuclease Q family protein [Candidatus Omnitrophota bacterium]HQL40683.1 endonuclease Q family protein [Candidatus Omnitrophota bacterium]